jgi:5-methylcytosine-specific restriction protein A
MPTKPLAFCSQPGCAERVINGRCAAHSRAIERERGSAHARGYGRRWEHFRRWLLVREPLCRDCSTEGGVGVASEVHHIVKVKDAPARMYDVTNVMPLCRRHHSIRTAAGE